MGNIYLYMRKNTTKKMKIKKIQLNKTKNNRQKKKGSVVRRMTMKKRGGMGTSQSENSTSANNNSMMALMGASGISPYTQDKMSSLETIVGEDIERRAAFVLREIYHILRKNELLGTTSAINPPVVELLKMFFNPASGSAIEKALNERMNKNTDFGAFLTQLQSQKLAMLAPSTVK
jgi:hypothetical protein